MKNKQHKFYEYKQVEFEEFVAEVLYSKIKNILNKNGKINIALSGGNTPLPILNLLKQKEINWQRLNFFIVDERCVSTEDSKSNFGNINRVFFNEVSSNKFTMILPNMSFENSIKEYKNKILKNVYLNSNGFPVFDLIILGMGDDGHTASLFPHTNGLKENKEWVVLNKIPQLEVDRITLTYPVLLNAKEIIVIVKGDLKRKIIEELYSNSTTKYPMQKIVDEFDNLNWLIG